MLRFVLVMLCCAALSAGLQTCPQYAKSASRADFSSNVINQCTVLHQIVHYPKKVVLDDPDVLELNLFLHAWREYLVHYDALHLELAGTRDPVTAAAVRARLEQTGAHAQLTDALRRLLETGMFSLHEAAQHLGMRVPPETAEPLTRTLNVARGPARTVPDFKAQTRDHIIQGSIGGAGVFVLFCFLMLL